MGGSRSGLGMGASDNVVHLSFVKEGIHCSTLEPLTPLPGLQGRSTWERKTLSLSEVSPRALTP
jgi:hypothetical protein